MVRVSIEGELMVDPLIIELGTIISIYYQVDATQKESIFLTLAG